jgi:hypothetical protein
MAALDRLGGAPAGVAFGGPSLVDHVESRMPLCCARSAKPSLSARSAEGRNSTAAATDPFCSAVIFSGEVPTPMKLTSSFFRPAGSNSCVVSQTSLMCSDDTPMTLSLRAAGS